MTAVDDGYRTRAADLDPLGKAVDALRAAYLWVCDDLRSNGWVLAAERPAWAGDHFIVRFAMHREGVVVSDCGFAVGPGRDVVFTRPAERAVTGALDIMGEAEFHHLIETWAAEVQAGIGHRWRYEAKRRGDAVGPSSSLAIGAPLAKH